MDVDEALALLELAPDATPKEGRRAYLRLVKRFKPEQDPEGFKRVREAYESVQPFLELPAECRRPIDPFEAQGSDFSPPWVTPGDDTSLVASEPIEGDPIERLNTTDLSESMGEEHGNRADEKHDDFDEDDFGQEEHDYDEDENLNQLPLDRKVLSFPFEASYRERTDWLDTVCPRLIELFDAREDGLRPTWTALSALGLLIERRDWKRARQLTRSLGRWQEESASKHEVFRGAEAARWAVFSELTKLGPRLPVKVVRAVAHGLVNDDANAVALELAQFKKHRSDEAEEVLAKTARRAPTLHEILREHLAAAPTRHTIPHSRGRTNIPFMAIIGGLVVVTNIIRVCATGGERSPDGPIRVEMAAPQRESDEDGRSPNKYRVPDLNPAATPDGEALFIAHDRLEQYAEDNPNILALNERVYAAFQASSCADIVQSFMDLEALTRDEALTIREEVQRYWAEFIIACPEQARQLKEKP